MEKRTQMNGVRRRRLAGTLAPPCGRGKSIRQFREIRQLDTLLENSRKSVSGGTVAKRRLRECSGNPLYSAQFRWKSTEFPVSSVRSTQVIIPAGENCTPEG
jgi:hypothetical protein